MTKKNPAALARAHRVLNAKLFPVSIDTQDPSEFHFATQSESPAVRRIAAGFNLSIYHARTVCELAGIGCAS